MGTSPMEALDRLLAATGTGEIDAICERRAVRLLGVFGSAVRRHRDATAPPPRDLDVSVEFAGEPDVLALLDDLVVLTQCDVVDVAVLNHANPVLRGEGLVGIGLYESERGAWAVAQMAALAEKRDTRHLRLLDLELLSG